MAATREAMARIARSIVPHVTVTVPVLTLLRTLTTQGEPPQGTGLDDRTTPPRSAGPLPASSSPPPPPAPSRVVEAACPQVAHLDGYGPIDDHTATLLAARAPSFRRLLTHPHTGAVLALGRGTYTVPADLRAYLRLRDATCRFPGCSRAARRCDTDHTVPYVTGGTTDATNLAHLCRTHHRLKHATRWDARHTGTDGTLAWTSPTGQEHTTRPALAFPAPDEITDAVADDDPPPF
ncbi:hypothetical protein GCM10025864_22400 [Luteimicrobium album]|uniref:HNH nuclease domain-containing protein n=1 Tax=Luteimicrobium album TaxID=1054550 RepID=A0ABQ6I2I6_9MICO|nr:hypothetical protein GCM10025864_22400 [Luteimicrobium album]